MSFIAGIKFTLRGNNMFRGEKNTRIYRRVGEYILVVEC